MNTRKNQNGFSHLIALSLVAIPIIFILLGLLLWNNSNNNSESSTNLSAVSQEKIQRAILFKSEFADWGVRLPLPSNASDFVTDSYSFAGNSVMQSYGISLKGGSGCLATPDYIVTIARVKSDVVITKPPSYLENKSYSGHYGETWSRFYHDRLKENESGKGSVKAVKDIGDYTFVLDYISSKCADPDSSTDNGKKVNKLRDDSAAELKGYFNNLELLTQKRS